METMISKKIFRRIPMFDYQALCKERIPTTSASSYILTVILFNKIPIIIILILIITNTLNY